MNLATTHGVSTLWILLIVLLVLLCFGGYAASGGYSYSPVGILVVILIVLLLTGRL